MNTATVIVGTLAAICLIIAYGNQSMVTIQSKNTVSISQIMIFVVTLACGLFVVLGVLTCFSGAIPAGVILSLSNVIVGTFAGIVC